MQNQNLVPFRGLVSVAVKSTVTVNCTALNLGVKTIHTLYFVTEKLNST